MKSPPARVTFDSVNGCEEHHKATAGMRKKSTRQRISWRAAFQRGRLPGSSATSSDCVRLCSGHGLSLGHAGPQQIRFHDLRHTCAMLRGKHANPEVVSEMLNHPSVRITPEIYSPLHPEMPE